MIDEYFERPEGLSAVIDEYFERNSTSQTRSIVMNTYAVIGPRRKVSPAFSGTVTRTASPSRNQCMTRDTCTVGWKGWQARLAFYDIDEEPWYSPSCGEESEYVGNIHVRLLSETAIETQIKFSDDDEWQPPVVLTFQLRDASSERDL